DENNTQAHEPFPSKTPATQWRRGFGHCFLQPPGRLRRKTCRALRPGSRRTYGTRRRQGWRRQAMPRWRTWRSARGGATSVGRAGGGRGVGAGVVTGGTGSLHAQHVYRVGDRYGFDAVVDRLAGVAVTDEALRALRFRGHANVAAAGLAVAGRLAGHGAVHAG